MIHFFLPFFYKVPWGGDSKKFLSTGASRKHPYCLLYADSSLFQGRNKCEDDLGR